MKQIVAKVALLCCCATLNNLVSAQLSSVQVQQSVVYQMAKDADQDYVVNLIPVADQLKKIDQQKLELTTSLDDESLNSQEFLLLEQKLDKLGLHQITDFNRPPQDASGNQIARSQLLNKYPQSLRILADMYYRLGHLKLTTTAQDGDTKAQSSSLFFSALFKSSAVDSNRRHINDLPSPDDMTPQEEAILQIFTAASLNHKRARFVLAFILENGLIPSREIIKKATSEGQKYYFLRHIVDPDKSVLFKYLDDLTDKKAYQALAEFEADTKAQAISNLYLSSQITSHQMLYEYLTSEDFAAKKDDSFTDFSVSEANRKKLAYLEEQNRILDHQASPAQMSLGVRFQFGIGVGEDCDTSTHYYEAAGRQTFDFIEQTHGLVGPERLKLSLMGPLAIEESSLSSVISLEHLYTSVDVVELLDQQGQYGNTESLNFLGFSALMGKGKMKRNFARAYELFKKALDIDKKDPTANYCLGLMYMLGLVPDQEADIETAVKHYTRAGDDGRAMNALGVIYYIAPDPFEVDPAKLLGFKSVRRDRKKSKFLLDKAVEKNNVQAHFNLGAIRLDETNKDTFSFSKAYDHFKNAATLGHTLAAYNIGVMHYTGLGTFKSCNVANAFLKHVVTMGKDSVDMQRAYKLVEKGRYAEATWLYMELAEMGQGVAALNAALLLEKFDVFDTQRMLLGQIASQVFNKDQSDRERLTNMHKTTFDLNKQLAFRYLQISLYQKETEDEASLKIADFMYYGTAGLQDFAQALSIYKVTQQQTQSGEIRGHALLKLGMIHQFGDGGVVDIDHDLAQLYYEKAMKENSSVQAPVYMMSLYSKWQRLDVQDTLVDFVVEFVQEPWSRGSALIVTGIVYLLCLWGTVKVLRSQALKDDQ